MDIQVRLKVSETHGVKLGLFSEAGAELYDRHVWSVHKDRNTFYFTRHIKVGENQTTIFFHRELLGLTVADKIVVDHKNRNGCDNRPENLRLCSNQQNLFNRGAQSNNTTGYKGVSPRGKKFRASIQHNGKHIHIGYFDTALEAHVAYCRKALEFYGEFARFN